MMEKKNTPTDVSTSSGVGRFAERLAVVVTVVGSQSELGRRSGVSQQQIARFITGEREPLLSTALALARACGVSLGWLTGEGEKAAASARCPDMMLLRLAAHDGQEIFAELEIDVSDRTKAEVIAQIYETYLSEHRSDRLKARAIVLRRAV
jgi:transcriptional regulator with XRE-family HTH domain